MKNKKILVLILAVLVFFPIPFLFFLSFVMYFDKKFDNYIVFFYLVIFFTYSFYLREYGISFEGNAFDDVPAYHVLFEIFYLNEYFISDFLSLKIYQEPLYTLLFYFIGLITNNNFYIYLFLNYFFSIALFVLFLKLFFKNKYLLGFFFIISFGSMYFYLTGHILRQSLGYPMILFAIYFQIKNKNYLALLFIFMASMMHYSFLIFFVFYMLHSLITYKIDVKYKILFVIVIVGAIISFLSYISFQPIISKVILYSERDQSISLIRMLYLIFIFIFSMYLFKLSSMKIDYKLRILSYYTVALSLTMLISIIFGFWAIISRYTIIISPTFFILVYYYLIEYKIKNELLFILLFLTIFLRFIQMSNLEKTMQSSLLYGNFGLAITLNLSDYYEMSKKSVIIGYDKIELLLKATDK